MPIGERETHPYLMQGQIKGATKLILGSFPVYECTDQDNQLKRNNRQSEGTVRFFYGSARSGLWGLYRDNIDNSIELPPNPDLILKSLNKRHIAISDTIKSCERYIYKIDRTNGKRILNPYSSEDAALNVIEWNTTTLTELINNGVTKIICTSKGVLNDLERQIICKSNNPLGQVDKKLSANFQAKFIAELGGNHNQIINSISKVFTVGNIHVTALAIPSPGSPQRQLATFGYNSLNWRCYADKYFKKAFIWLNQ